MLPLPSLHKRAFTSSHEEGAALQTRVEYADILAKRVVFSRAHTVLCTSMLLAGLVEVLWILLPIGSGAGSLPEHPLFVLVEGYVTLGLLVEILLRAVLQRGEFCQKWSNVFDVTVAAISVLSSALFAAGLETPAEMLLGTVIVTARIVFRLLRLVSLSRGFRQQARAADRQLDVCLDHGGMKATESDDEADVIIR